MRQLWCQANRIEISLSVPSTGGLPPVNRAPNGGKPLGRLLLHVHCSCCLWFPINTRSLSPATESRNSCRARPRQRCARHYRNPLLASRRGDTGRVRAGTCMCPSMHSRRVTACTLGVLLHALHKRRYDPCPCRCLPALQARYRMPSRRVIEEAIGGGTRSDGSLRIHDAPLCDHHCSRTQKTCMHSQRVKACMYPLGVS